jgi:hypothetical protein
MPWTVAITVLHRVGADDKRTRDRGFDRLVKQEMQRRQLKARQKQKP